MNADAFSLSEISKGVSFQTLAILSTRLRKMQPARASTIALKQ